MSGFLSLKRLGDTVLAASVSPPISSNWRAPLMWRAAVFHICLSGLAPTAIRPLIRLFAIPSHSLAEFVGSVA